MMEAWFDRLVRAVEADGRSLRALSLAIGAGPNYVHYNLKATLGKM